MQKPLLLSIYLIISLIIVVSLFSSHVHSQRDEQEDDYYMDKPHRNTYETPFNIPPSERRNVYMDDDDNFEKDMNTMKAYASETTNYMLIIVLPSCAVSIGIGLLCGKKSSFLIGVLVSYLAFVNVFFMISFIFSFRYELERYSFQEIADCNLAKLIYFQECENQQEFKFYDFYKSGFVSKTGKLISTRCFKLISDFLICDQNSKSYNYFQIMQRVIGKSVAEFTNSFLGNLNVTTIVLLLLFSNVVFVYVAISVYVCLKVGTPFILEMIKANNEKKNEILHESSRTQQQPIQYSEPQNVRSYEGQGQEKHSYTVVDDHVATRDDPSGELIENK